MIENEPKDGIFLRFSCGDDVDEEMLNQMPHDVFMDLNVFYRKLVKRNYGITTSPLMQEDLEKSGLCEEELFDVAKENTEKLFKPSLFRLEEIVDQLMGGKKAENIYDCSDGGQCRNEMYVLTNEYGSYGAVWLMYNDVLQNIADRMGSSYYILPSSIHELILVGENEDVSPAVLKNMVTEINKTVVDTGDKLSDSVYYYDLSDMQLRRIA